MRAQVAANPSTPDNWTDIAKFIVAEVPQQEPKPIGGSNSE
jgi:hypothetical protein